MRTIVHLSDLHFGRVDQALLQPLAAVVKTIAPHLVVVSGDLTQRARSRQFKEARQFLDTLPQPQIVVPGNHDIPMFNVVSRFLRPLVKYRRHVTHDLEPFYADDEIAVAGINTARSLTIKDGRVNEDQIARASARLAAFDEHTVKIIVTHHPFDQAEGDDDLVGKAKIAMKAFAACGADLLLSGHLHTSRTGSTDDRYKIRDFAALVIQAGTATSTRGRGESNSFNVLHVQSARVEIERFSWVADESAFLPAGSEVFRRVANRWMRA